MENAHFIARLLSVVYLAVGLGMLISPGYYKKHIEQLVKSTSLTYLGAIMALVAGFAIVTFHNVWQGWAILVTLIGYIALLKGGLLLIFPNQMHSLSMKLIDKRNFPIYGIVVLALGIVFGYFGFIA
jgi:hypothetical protein